MKGRLKCRVSGGMFSDERTVIIRRRGNGSIEFFVTDSYVHGSGNEGSVDVVIFSRDDGKWVELPTPYRDSIPVDDAQLVVA